MAKVYPDLAGGYSGNVGKSSYFRREGDTFVRTIPTPKKEASDAQIAQWLRMEMLGQIGSCLSEAVKVGFPVVRRKMWSPFNMFINKNKDIVTVDMETGDVTVAYEQLACSSGKQLEPTVTASIAEGTRAVSFEVSPGGTFYMTCQPDDAVYGVVMETVKFQAIFLPLGTRGEGGSESVTLPGSWDTGSVEVYAFATDAAGRRASSTAYLSIG